MRTYYIFSFILLVLVLVVIDEVDRVLHRVWAKELAIHSSWCIASHEIKLAGTAGSRMEDRVLNCTTKRRSGLTHRSFLKNKKPAG